MNIFYIIAKKVIRHMLGTDGNKIWVSAKELSVILK